MNEPGGPFYTESFYGKHLYQYKIEKWVVRKKTKFQTADIVYISFFGKSVFLDEKIQSAEVDEFIFHEALVQPGMLFHPEPERVYIIGGGEGATLREVLKHKSVKKCIMCDIDKEFVFLCKEFLQEWHEGSFEDKRTILRFKDARKDIEKEKNEHFDIIISDLTEPLEKGPSLFLFTFEFFNTIKNKLKKNGIFVLQAGSTAPYYNDFFLSLYKTLKQIFPLIMPYEVFIPSFQMPWGFILCSKEKNIKIRKEKIELKFLTQKYIEKIFTLPLYIKKILGKKGRVLTDKKPFVWEEKI